MSETNIKGRVVNIGKLSVYNKIPRLSYIVVKKPDGSYVSTCLHLLVDGYGNSAIVAENDMKHAVKSFLRSNFEHLSKDDAWQNLKDLSHSDEYSHPLWNAYRDFEFDRAANGKASESVRFLTVNKIRQQYKKHGNRSKSYALRRKVR